MGGIRKLCIITDRYPTEQYPANTFLDQLVCQFSDNGIECTVVAPYSRINDVLKHNQYLPQRVYIKETLNGNRIKVHCKTFFAPIGRKAAGINFAGFYQHQFNKAVESTIENETDHDFDAYYGHFIAPSGFAAVKMGKKYHKPSFIAYGECSLEQELCNYSLDDIVKGVEGVSGVVAVSTKNKDELLAHHVVSEDKIEVFPNAINQSVFYHMDKREARKKLGFSQDSFIVAFVGYFIDRKGTLRLSEALSGLHGVKSIFIGSGEQEPNCDGILFKGRLPHHEIVTYLNAADVFVLPTLAEGCCNAIVEAMACGLPIISSDLPFNDDILNEGNSVRVDPMNVDEIQNAINKLWMNKELRTELSKGALQMAKSLTIQSRAENILHFMESKGS